MYIGFEVARYTGRPSLTCVIGNALRWTEISQTMFTSDRLLILYVHTIHVRGYICTDMRNDI